MFAENFVAVCLFCLSYVQKPYSEKDDKTSSMTFKYMKQSWCFRPRIVTLSTFL